VLCRKVCIQEVKRLHAGLRLSSANRKQLPQMPALILSALYR
jgi:hypothetical protein